MGKLVEEFKEFINKGNLVDMAVAFVLGTAFATLVKSFTEDILMQVLAVVIGKPDFGGLSFTLNDAVIRYGSFLNALVTFLSMALAMFLVVKAYNKMRKPVEEESGPDEIELLTEIRDALKNRQ